ncbi:MAG: serine protease [Flavobacteriales bacterium]|nr:serine protease [Flavobacteriales bacterium]MBT6980059.1 serine protease [Flavobacteriales bacterium]
MNTITRLGLLLFISFTATSCATLISGTKQSVLISSNIPDARISVDDEQALVGSGTMKLKRKDEHRILVEQEGIELEEFVVKKKSNPVLWLNSILAVPALVGGIYLASQKETVTYGSGSWAYTAEEPKEPEFVIGLVLASTCYLAPLIPMGIDAAFGAGSRFDKEVKLNLTALPKKVTPDESLNLSVSDVNVKLQSGTKLGSIHSLNGTELSDLLWESTVNVSFEDLIINTNNDLNSFGFNVSGLRNVEERMVPGGKESYLIEAEIKEIKYDIHVVGRAAYESKTALSITWRVLNPKNKDVAFFLNVESTGFSQTNGGALPVYEALRHSLYKLIENEEFRDLVTNSKPIKTEPAVAGEAISITNNTSRGDAYADVSELAKACKSSVVTITNPSGHGSGFFISSDGLLLTNAHVVEGYDRLLVRLGNGIDFEPEVISIDSDNDLALLKVPGSGYSPLSFAKESVLLGEKIVVIGTPAEESLSQSVTAGIVSGERLIEGKKMIQSDAGISPGNSGGPMLNMKGEIIGVVTSKIVASGVEGVGFAIPSAVVIDKLDIVLD